MRILLPTDSLNLFKYLGFTVSRTMLNVCKINKQLKRPQLQSPGCGFESYHQLCCTIIVKSKYCRPLPNQYFLICAIHNTLGHWLGAEVSPCGSLTISLDGKDPLNNPKRMIHTVSYAKTVMTSASASGSVLLSEAMST